jgi:hypothetical protein
MMGGLTYMVNDKMYVGIVKSNLMHRVNPRQYEELLKKEGCKPMDFTGRPVRGFVFIEPYAIDLDDSLVYWV